MQVVNRRIHLNRRINGKRRMITKKVIITTITILLLFLYLFYLNETYDKWAFIKATKIAQGITSIMF